MKTISNEISVGIYDHCQQIARIYHDRTVATLPYVKWVGNTGGYAERKIRITGAAHEEILLAAEDGATDTAWEVINAVADGGYRPRPTGRPAEMSGGRRVQVYLDDETLAIAERLGGGNVSAGIRAALATCRATCGGAQ
jgi:hypothetical protein